MRTDVWLCGFFDNRGWDGQLEERSRGGVAISRLTNLRDIKFALVGSSLAAHAAESQTRSHTDLDIILSFIYRTVLIVGHRPKRKRPIQETQIL